MIYSATFSQNTPQLFGTERASNFGDSRDLQQKNLRVSMAHRILKPLNQHLIVKENHIEIFA